MYSFALTDYKLKAGKILNYVDNTDMFIAQGSKGKSNSMIDILLTSIPTNTHKPTYAVMMNTVTVRGNDWAQNSALNTKYFWTHRSEWEIIFQPVVGTDVNKEYIDHMLQRNANGVIKKCGRVAFWITPNADGTECPHGRWDPLSESNPGDFEVGDTLEQVEACCPIYEPACCRGQGGGDCCQGDCGEGEGDCDGDSDCLPGLVCGDDNCVTGTYPAGTLVSDDDCCKKAP